MVMYKKRFFKEDVEDEATYEKKQPLEQDVIYDYDTDKEELDNEERKINMVKKMFEFNKIERKQKRA